MLKTVDQNTLESEEHSVAEHLQKACFGQPQILFPGVVQETLYNQEDDTDNREDVEIGVDRSVGNEDDEATVPSKRRREDKAANEVRAAPAKEGELSSGIVHEQEDAMDAQIMDIEDDIDNREDVEIGVDRSVGDEDDEATVPSKRRREDKADTTPRENEVRAAPASDGELSSGIGEDIDARDVHPSDGDEVPLVSSRPRRVPKAKETSLRKRKTGTSVRKKRASEVRLAPIAIAQNALKSSEDGVVRVPSKRRREDNAATPHRVNEVRAGPANEGELSSGIGEDMDARDLVSSRSRRVPKGHHAAKQSGKPKRRTRTSVREKRASEVTAASIDQNGINSSDDTSAGERSIEIPTADQPPKFRGRPKRFQLDYLRKAKDGEKPAYEVVNDKHKEKHKYLSLEERKRLVVFVGVETEADVVKEFRMKLWHDVGFEVASHQQLPEQYAPRRNEHMWLKFGDNKIKCLVDQVEKMCIFKYHAEYVAEESMEYCLADIQLFERHHKYLYANRDKIDSLYHLFSSNHFLAWDAQAKLLNHNSRNLSARSVLQENIEKRKQEDLKLLDLHTLYEYKSKTFEEYLVMNEFIAGHEHDVPTWSSDFIQYVKKKKNKISSKQPAASSAPRPKPRQPSPITASRIRCYHHPVANCNGLRTFMNNTNKPGSIREHWMLYHRDPTTAVQCMYCKSRRPLFKKEKDYIAHLYEEHKSRLDFMDLVPSVVSSYRTYGSAILSNLTRPKMSSFMQVHCNGRDSYDDKLRDIQNGTEGDKLVIHEKRIELESQLRLQNK